MFDEEGLVTSCLLEVVLSKNTYAKLLCLSTGEWHESKQNHSFFCSISTLI